MSWMAKVKKGVWPQLAVFKCFLLCFMSCFYHDFVKTLWSDTLNPHCSTYTGSQVPDFAVPAFDTLQMAPPSCGCLKRNWIVPMAWSLAVCTHAQNQSAWDAWGWRLHTCWMFMSFMFQNASTLCLLAPDDILWSLHVQQKSANLHVLHVPCRFLRIACVHTDFRSIHWFSAPCFSTLRYEILARSKSS